VSRRNYTGRLRSELLKFTFQRKGESERQKLLTTAEVAELLGVAVYTLKGWRNPRRRGWHRGRERGPVYVKLGALVRYRLEDVGKFVERRLVRGR